MHVQPPTQAFWASCDASKSSKPASESNRNRSRGGSCSRPERLSEGGDDKQSPQLAADGSDDGPSLLRRAKSVSELPPRRVSFCDELASSAKQPASGLASAAQHKDAGGRKQEEGASSKAAGAQEQGAHHGLHHTQQHASETHQHLSPRSVAAQMLLSPRNSGCSAGHEASAAAAEANEHPQHENQNHQQQQQQNKTYTGIYIRRGVSRGSIGSSESSGGGSFASFGGQYSSSCADPRRLLSEPHTEAVPRSHSRHKQTREGSLSGGVHLGWGFNSHSSMDEGGSQGGAYASTAGAAADSCCSEFSFGGVESQGHRCMSGEDRRRDNRRPHNPSALHSAPAGSVCLQAHKDPEEVHRSLGPRARTGITPTTTQVCEERSLLVQPCARMLTCSMLMTRCAQENLHTQQRLGVACKRLSTTAALCVLLRNKHALTDNHQQARQARGIVAREIAAHESRHGSSAVTAAGRVARYENTLQTTLRQCIASAQNLALLRC